MHVSMGKTVEKSMYASMYGRTYAFCRFASKNKK